MDTFCQTINIIATSTDPFEINNTSLAISPNPFSSETTVQFSLPENEYAKIDVFDLSGRKIKTIAERNFFEGIHEVILEKENLGAGIYLLQLTTDSGVSIQKIIIQ